MGDFNFNLLHYKSHGSTGEFLDTVAKPAWQFGRAMQIFLCSETVKTIKF